MGTMPDTVRDIRTPTPQVIEAGGAVYLQINDPQSDLLLRFTSVGDALVVANAVIDAARMLRRIEVEARSAIREAY